MAAVTLSRPGAGAGSMNWIMSVLTRSSLSAVGLPGGSVSYPLLTLYQSIRYTPPPPAAPLDMAGTSPHARNLDKAGQVWPVVHPFPTRWRKVSLWHGSGPIPLSCRGGPQRRRRPRPEPAGSDAAPCWVRIASVPVGIRRGPMRAGTSGGGARRGELAARRASIAIPAPAVPPACHIGQTTPVSDGQPRSLISG
jgi:hypothetical protein